MTYEAVKAAVEEYFSDTSRPASETLEGLEMLTLDIEGMMECLREDMGEELL